MVRFFAVFRVLVLAIVAGTGACTSQTGTSSKDGSPDSPKVPLGLDANSGPDLGGGVRDSAVASDGSSGYDLAGDSRDGVAASDAGPGLDVGGGSRDGAAASDARPGLDVGGGSRDGAAADGNRDPAMPLFLFAGQSNMVGNVDRDLLTKLMSELAQGPPATLQQRLTADLKSWYDTWNGGYASYGYSSAMVDLEARELIRLHGAGLVDADLAQPISTIYCKFDKPVPSLLGLTCGQPFGPELVFGRALAATRYVPAAFVKVAQGGTSMYTNWLPPTAATRTGRPMGPLYTGLSRSIKSLQTSPADIHPNCAKQQCRWSALIWFQGENDCFEKASADEYQENLRDLIADVRSEIGNPNLPVIILEMGAWAQSLKYGSTVLAAQKAVVNADSRARLVLTADLSGFYHYDSAAQLIMGARVADMLIPML